MTDRNPGFADLIEALEIFNKYADKYAGTHCEHDVLYICGVDIESVSEKDKARLDHLGFFEGREDGFESCQ